MSEFRSGNKAKSHPYPATPRASAAAGAGPFAENFAIGPGPDVFAAPGGTSIPWTALAVGAPGVNVPITPLSSGNIIISAVVSLRNVGVADQDDVFVKLQANGVDITGDLQISMDASQARVVPLLMRITGALGVPINISAVVTGAADISIDAGNSTLEVHEAPTATG